MQKRYPQSPFLASLEVVEPPPRFRTPQAEEIRFDRSNPEQLDLQALARDGTTHFSRLPAELVSLLQQVHTAAYREQQPKPWQVAIIGDACVGKSALLRRFVHGTFEYAY